MSKASLMVRILILSLLIGFLALTSTASNINAQSSSQNVGFVRFAHTAIDVGPVDIYQGTAGHTPIITNLSYGEFTDFLTINATTTGFVARAAGSGPTGRILVRLNWGVKGNESTVLILAGLASNIEVIIEPILIVRNDLKGKARIRVVNMVWRSKLTVRSNNKVVLGQGLGPIGVSDREIDPGTYPLEVVDSTGNVVASTKDVEFKANTVYTLILAGNKDGTPTVTILNVVSEQDTTRVKIVNKSGAPVDIYNKATGKVLAPNLADGANTDFMAMPSGEVTFVARKAGSAPNSKELAALPTQLRPARDVTIVINPDRTIDVADEVLTPANQASEVQQTTTPTSTLTATPS